LLRAALINDSGWASYFWPAAEDRIFINK
jgi:hypothetical protein